MRAPARTWSDYGNVPDPRQEDVEEDGRPAHAAYKPKSDDDGGEGNDPEDILGKENLVRCSARNMKVGRNNRVRDARGHREVGDGSDKQSDGEDVVEDLFTVAGSEAQEVVGKLRDTGLARCYSKSTMPGG